MGAFASRVYTKMHDFTPYARLDAPRSGTVPHPLGLPALLSDATVKDSLHNQLATGVQRRCCHDCVLIGIVTGLSDLVKS